MIDYISFIDIPQEVFDECQFESERMSFGMVYWVKER